jgi:hypothetical protein
MTLSVHTTIFTVYTNDIDCLYHAFFYVYDGNISVCTRINFEHYSTGVDIPKIALHGTYVIDLDPGSWI